MNFDWKDLAFGDKKPVKGLKATFIAAPREMSQARIKEIIKTYLPSGNLIFGISKEPYVEGFEGQPQFRLLKLDDISAIANQVNKASKKNKVYTLRYFQRELPFLIDKLGFYKVLLVNGSWRYVFHSLPAYYSLISRNMPYEFISPFTSLQEGFNYEMKVLSEIKTPVKEGIFTEAEMLETASRVAKLSFDYNYQTGVVLGKPAAGGKYKWLAAAFNKVVPVQSYALHFGSSREKHFSPPNDLNHYDAVHAEVELLINAQKQKLSLKGTTMFINLLPCPTCARMLAETDIEELVYSVDHTDGYAVKMLEAAHKKVRRVVL